MRRRRRLSADEVVQHCGAGEIAVRFAADGSVELSASPRDLAGPLDDGLVAALLEDVGLSISDLAGAVWLAGAGLTFAHVPVVESAVARARPALRPLSEYAERLDAAGATVDPVEGLNIHAVTGDAPDLTVHARVFVPGLDVAEDAATGSAAAGLGMALVAAGRLPEGGGYTISQGAEMGRPSLLSGRVEATAGRPTRCHVAGRVQRVASGEVEVPASAVS